MPILTTGTGVYRSSSSLSPTLTFIETGTLTSAASTLTKVAANLGTASATRRVIVTVAGQIPSGRTVSSATIDGIAATTHVDLRQTNNSWCAIISASVPSDATGTIVITLSAAIFNDAIYAVYVTDDSQLNSTTPTTGSATASATTSVAPTVSGTAGGILVGVTAWANGSAKSPITVSGYTQDVNTADMQGFSLKPIVSTGTNTATTTWTGNFDAASGLAAWF